jgi:Phage tail tube protein
MDMKKLVLVAMAQSAKGTPASPVVGTNAILCRGLTPSIIEGKAVERQLIRGAKGNFGSLWVSEHRMFEFEVELAGSGTAGTAPKFAPLLLGCSMSQTVSAGVSVVYAPTASVGTYLTLMAYLDGVLFKMTDAIGTVAFTLNAEEIPVMKFSFTGTYETMTDVTFPAGISFSGFVDPLTVGKINTPTFTLDGIALVMKSFGIDLANKVTWRNWVGDSGAKSPDRTPVGNMAVEMTSVATKNWGEAVRLGTEMPVVLNHGVNAGNIVSLTGPKLQINAKPTISDDEGIALLNCTFAVKPNAGNDEIALTFT